MLKKMVIRPLLKQIRRKIKSRFVTSFEEDKTYKTYKTTQEETFRHFKDAIQINGLMGALTMIVKDAEKIHLEIPTGNEKGPKARNDKSIFNQLTPEGEVVDEEPTSVATEPEQKESLFQPLKSNVETFRRDAGFLQVLLEDQDETTLVKNAKYPTFRKGDKNFEAEFIEWTGKDAEGGAG